jgi:hypothetical protein
MSVRSHTLAGIVVGFLAIGASAPLQAQDPAARPATPDTAKARADRKAAADRAAAGIHLPDTSGYRAMGDSTRAVLAADCVNADSAGRPMTTGNEPRPTDLPARTQGRTDTARAAIAADTARGRTDSTSPMASRTTTPCPPTDSARTGQTGATRDTTTADQNRRIDAHSTARDSTRGNTTTRGTSTTRATSTPRAVTPPTSAAPR